MQDLEHLGRQLQHSGKADGLQKLAASREGQKLRGMLNGKAVEQAIQTGDEEAMRSLLSQVLSTREGRDLAQAIQKLMQS